MNYSVEKKKGQVVISIELDAANWESALEKAYQSNKGKYSHTGFRKGHVPRKVLETIYGKTLFHEDALNEAITKYYYEILDKEHSIVPVDMPEIDITEINENGVKLTAAVTVKPEVTLGKYKGLKIKKNVFAVTDEDVKAELEKAAEKSARMVKVENRGIQNGDEATFDFSGSVNGEKFEGGTAENYKLVIGSGKFIPGFEEQMIDLKTGDSKDINVKFPDDYHAEELKGKDAVFAVTVREIHTKELPSIDDELAKDISEFDTLKDWQDDVRNALEKSAKEREDRTLENDIISEVVKNAKIEIPNVMIESQIDNFIAEFETTLSYQGLKLDDYLKYTNSTSAQMREVYKERADEAVRTRLVLEAIINKENMMPTPADVENSLKEAAEKEGKKIDEFKKSLKQEHLNYIMNEVVSKKLMEFLKKENSIV